MNSGHTVKKFNEIHRALANPVRRDVLIWLKNPATYFPKRQRFLGDDVSAGVIRAA